MCDGELNLDTNELCADWDIKLLGWLRYVLLLMSERCICKTELNIYFNKNRKFLITLPFRKAGAMNSVAAYKYKVRLALAPGCRGNCVIKFSSLHLNILLSVDASSVDCIDNSIVSIGT